MDIDYDVPKPRPTYSAGPKRQHQFDGVTHGASIWYPLSQSRRGLMNSFRNWKRLTGSPLIARTHFVTASDPRGAGIRIFFIDPQEAEHDR